MTMLFSVNALLVFGLCLRNICALVHNLHIVNDDRHLFKIETFGFYAGGGMDIAIKDLSIIEASLDKTVERKNEVLKVGFLLRKAKTETSALSDVEKFIEKQECILDEDKRHPDDIFVDISDKNNWKSMSKSHEFKSTESGLYSLLFARCHSIDSKSSSNYIKSVSFRAHIEFHNAGPNYLSAGDIPLPVVYMVFFVCFAVCTGYWCYMLTLPQAVHGLVHHVHYMMAVLIGGFCFVWFFKICM